MVSFFIGFGVFFCTTQATKLWIFSILTGQQKRDISYSRHLLLHDSLRAGSLVEGIVGKGAGEKNGARKSEAHFSSPHSSRRVRRFSVLCPLPKQVSLLAG